jgi:FKBP-type peptidyl-prolyl cis-trans isomerase FkpA
VTLRLVLLSVLAACGTPAPSTPADVAPTDVTPAAGAPAASAPTDAAAADGAAQSEDDKTLYALGQSVGMSLAPFHLTPAELVQVQKGLEDSIGGKPSAVPLEVYGPKIRDFGMARAQAAAKANAEVSTAFLKTLAETPGAAVTPSGVVYLELQAGSGAVPKESEVVTVHYRGTLANGTEFDSSYKRGEPAKFPLGGVIPCWTEGIQKMKVGTKAKLGCPAQLAYGDQGQGDIPPGSALLFEVELLATGA